MATEQPTATQTGFGSFANWGSVFGALVGLWVLVAPFALTGPIDTGTVTWNNVIACVVLAVLGVLRADAIRSTAELATNTPAELSGGLATLVGLWVVISPFVMTGSIAAGAAMWSNVGAGVIAFVPLAYVAYAIHENM